MNTDRSGGANNGLICFSLLELSKAPPHRDPHSIYPTILSASFNTLKVLSSLSTSLHSLGHDYNHFLYSINYFSLSSGKPKL